MERLNEIKILLDYHIDLLGVLVDNYKSRMTQEEKEYDQMIKNILFTSDKIRKLKEEREEIINRPPAVGL